MGLINLQTNLKSLKYGKDRFGGGDSGQPFIKNPIIDEPGKLTHADNDFLLRGGVRAPLRAAEDVARLTKYLFNPKSPSGLLFIAKQNLLSRTAIKTEASRGIGYAAGTLNEGVYTPLSTLAQAGVGFAGIHLNKQGIDPTGLIPGLGINNYEDIIKRQTIGDFKDTNRLVALSDAVSGNRSINNFNFQKGYSLNVGDSVITYGGGPNSTLGIGKTRIKFADQRTGVNSPSYKNNFRGGSNRELGYNLENIFIGARGNFSTSLLYSKLTGTSQDDLFGIDFFQNYNGKPTLPQDSNSVYTPFDAGTFPEMNILGNSYKNPYKTWSQQNLIDEDSDMGDASIRPDFRKKLNPTESPQNTFLSISPDYEFKNIESRVNLGNPGSRGDRSNYSEGKKDFTGANKGALDKINALPIYKSGGVKSSDEVNDLVKFRIAIIDPTNPSQKTFIHFRAFINSFSDSYKADWKSQKYMGRAEDLYKYTGFGRDISIDFTVAAQSKEELIPMFKKLNFLASSLAPTYTKSGYMAGNMSQMTVGGYLYEQPGIIESVNYEIPDNSPWEIGIPPIDKNGKKFYDSTVKELPHIINVSIKFTPIHKFRPSINDGGDSQERYIALANGVGPSHNNYDS